MEPLLVVLVSVVAIASLLTWMRQRGQRLVTLDRLASARLAGVPTPRISADQGVPDGLVARWLFLAGLRGPGATARFFAMSIGLGMAGAGIGLLVWFSGALDSLRADLEVIPGRIGFLVVPIVVALPVLLPFLFAAVPTVGVRRARRARVSMILSDLYPALELFASLAQAGLAFDAALTRVLTTLGPERPLGRELQSFRAEVLGGADRSSCFRRLARRIELPQVSSFTSAVIRAHEVGISLSATLRRQADDLRNELRERALARAQSLPARLVFPLVLCFLPGIFVMSLGPAFYGFLVETTRFGTNR
jgi:hypothetical protein